MVLYLWLTRYNLRKVEDSKDAASVERKPTWKDSMLDRDRTERENCTGETQANRIMMDRVDGIGPSCTEWILQGMASVEKSRKTARKPVSGRTTEQRSLAVGELQSIKETCLSD